MTREEAKKLLPVIQAFAEGKTVQYRTNGIWKDIKSKVSFTCDPSYYRIKPEPKYRPFKDAEECWQEMQKHEPFGRIRYKGDKVIESIRMLTFDAEVMPVYVRENKHVPLNYIFDVYTFADGTPFGVLEEE